MESLVAESGIEAGMVNVYAQGATSAIMIQENWDESVQTDVVHLLQKLIPRHEISRYAELVIAGEEVERDYLVSKLICGGYVKTSIVEEPGDFSIRGGIIDIFSPLYPDPLRIEFFQIIKGDAVADAVVKTENKGKTV